MQENQGRLESYLGSRESILGIKPLIQIRVSSLYMVCGSRSGSEGGGRGRAGYHRYW